jgi:hypothetical protein
MGHRSVSDKSKDRTFRIRLVCNANYNILFHGTISLPMGSLGRTCLRRIFSRRSRLLWASQSRRLSACESLRAMNRDDYTSSRPFVIRSNNAANPTLSLHPRQDNPLRNPRRTKNTEHLLVSELQVQTVQAERLVLQVRKLFDILCLCQRLSNLPFSLFGNNP